MVIETDQTVVANPNLVPTFRHPYLLAETRKDLRKGLSLCGSDKQKPWNVFGNLCSAPPSSYSLNPQTIDFNCHYKSYLLNPNLFLFFRPPSLCLRTSQPLLVFFFLVREFKNVIFFFIYIYILYFFFIKVFQARTL